MSKELSIGSRVKVQTGPYRGATGTVVQISPGVTQSAIYIVGFDKRRRGKDESAFYAHELKPLEELDE